uniref:Uncharacterized protein LOC102804514 n=1 Tax=Saccoglossus kowalevskii TaxID=10224 RepID=A0ABM0M6I4_SACKO|nr:PREDICTED: uncharacterized protein LOC102804514 [Saccoglossus kowalevskii]
MIKRTYITRGSTFDGNSGLAVTVSPDGTYSISVNNETWLNSANTFFNINGKLFSSDDKTLLLVKISDPAPGADNLGNFMQQSIVWQALTKSGQKSVVTGIRVYKDISAVVFSQNFPEELTGTSINWSNGVCTGFPSFKVEGKKGDKGFLSYGGLFLETTNTGGWHTGGLGINDGLYGGPLAIFDKNLNTVMISSFSEFMAGSLHLQNGVISFGIMGNASMIPQDYNYQTIVYYSRGINQAIYEWGETLLKNYGKTRANMKSDFMVNYLGYYTDNGAYYYYNTESGKNYEDTMLAVKLHIDIDQIPFRYLQLDSWWYFKGVGGGVKNWTARSDVFPHGSVYLSDKIGLPIIAHNRWWSSDTTYARVNGGKWNFIVEPDTQYSLPIDQGFWDYLLGTARDWGLKVYEQDWLNQQIDEMHITQSDVTIGRTWLMQMGKGASKNGMTIQYCMPMPRHVLQSVEIPVVTQIRASDDYHPGNDQWKIGLSSILHHAVGLAPYKDTMWTSSKQPGDPYTNGTELFTELQSVVSLLSSGPVGPGDKIGYMNKSLIMRSCNSDGLLLKPSKPATAIDPQIYRSALGSGGPDGEVWSTYSDIAAYRFGTLLWVNVKTSYPITPQQAGFGQLGSSYAFSDRNPAGTLVKFDEKNLLNQQKCGKDDFGLWHTTPEIPITASNRSVLLLGELSKWVKMSPQRVIDIITYSADIVLTLQGGVGEHIEFTLVYTDDLKTPQVVKCVFPESGKMQMHISNKKCHPY